MPTPSRIAIVGVAESDEIGVVPDKSSLQHHAEAAHNALDDCGLNKNDVDGLFTAGLSTMITGEYMGIRPSFAMEAFPDLDGDIRQSIARIKASPFIPNKDDVRGFVYDCATGSLSEVA